MGCSAKPRAGKYVPEGNLPQLGSPTMCICVWLCACRLLIRLLLLFRLLHYYYRVRSPHAFYPGVALR